MSKRTSLQPGEKNFAAALPSDLTDKFHATVPQGFTKKAVVQAAIELWCGFPREVHVEFLVAQAGNRTPAIVLKSRFREILTDMAADGTLSDLLEQRDEETDGEHAEEL